MGWLYDEDEYLPGNWDGCVGKTDAQRAVDALADAAILCRPGGAYDQRPRTSEAAVAAYHEMVEAAAIAAYTEGFPQEVYNRCASVEAAAAAAYGAAAAAEAAIELRVAEARERFFYAPGTRREKPLAAKPWRIGLATRLLRQCAAANAAYRRVAALCAGLPTDVEWDVAPAKAAEKKARAAAIAACAEWLRRYVPAAKGCGDEVLDGAARALESLGGATYGVARTLKVSEYETIKRVASMASAASGGCKTAEKILKIIKKWKEEAMP